MLNIDLSRSVRVVFLIRPPTDRALGKKAPRAMRVRGHTAKADEALSLLSFHRHASLRIKWYTQATENVPLLVETRLSGAALV